VAERALPQQAPAAASRVDLLTLAGRLPWLYAAAGLALGFLYLPILMVILFSFSQDVTTRFPIRGFTLGWYAEMLTTPHLLDATRNSVIVAAAAALLTALIATPAALALTRYRFRAGGWLTAFFVLPLSLPTLIIAVSLLLLFRATTTPLSLGTVILGHTLYLIPFTFLVIRARLLDMDRYIEEAARDLGASGWRTFWEVTFPLVRSSIVGAMFLVFAQSFDLFVITLMTIGPQSTLPLVVWSMLRTGVNPSINAISTVLIIISASLLLLASRFTKITVEV
jgi:spermidine/putrescine transport system permease protein